jgi:hypothetical protein
MSEGIAAELGRLRHALVEARLALRRTTENHKRVQAEREVAIIAGQYGGEPRNMGANQADRDRQMILDLSADGEYQAAAEALFDASADVLRLEAELDALLDVRRDREWYIRDHIADALIGREQIEEETR